MSAFGPKRTRAVALQMSAFGGKADMAIAGIRFCGRYWGQSGHGFVHRICLLLTQSGHLKQLVHFAPCLRKGRKEPERISDAPLHDRQPLLSCWMGRL